MNKEELKILLKENNIPFTDESIDLLIDYMDYVLDMNEKINLTAIKDRDAFMTLMVYDSALSLRLTSFDNKKVLDIGTGGGYPGTVIATLSSAHVDMMDSTNKKLEVIKSYPKKSFSTINARAEEYIVNHREEYDIVIARAVSNLSILLELAIPYVKVGGYFIAMKGKEGEEELKEATSSLKKLGAKVEKIDTINLPSGETRINILIKKESATNIKYPRKYQDIKRKPL